MCNRKKDKVRKLQSFKARMRIKLYTFYSVRNKKNFLKSPEKEFKIEKK